MSNTNEPSKEGKESKEVEQVEEVKKEELLINVESIKDLPVKDSEVVNAIETSKEVVDKVNTSLPTTSSISTPSVETTSLEYITKVANNLEAIKVIAKSMIGSKLCRIAKEEDFVVAVLTGQQIGLPFMVSINQIFPINGVPTMSAHLQRALLLRNKVIVEKIYDYEPIHNFGAIKDGQWEVVKEPGTNRDIPKVIGKGVLAEKPINSASLGVIDYVTKYRFTRYVEIFGNIEKMIVYSEFKYSDGVRAELASKDVWQKYPNRMLDARAFAIGAKEIASDILFGIYTVNELATVHNIDFTIDDSLEETIVNTK